MQSEKGEACAIAEGRLGEASVVVNKNPARGSKMRGVEVDLLH